NKPWMSSVESPRSRRSLLSSSKVQPVIDGARARLPSVASTIKPYIGCRSVCRKVLRVTARNRVIQLRLCCSAPYYGVWARGSSGAERTSAGWHCQACSLGSARSPHGQRSTVDRASLPVGRATQAVLTIGGNRGWQRHSGRYNAARRGVAGIDYLGTLGWGLE